MGKGVRHLGFYQTSMWKATRDSIILRDKGICQMCGSIVKGRGIVDHIIELTPQNYTDVDIAYGSDNLQYLCIDCHNKKTFSTPLVVNNEFDFTKRKKPVYDFTKE